MNSGDTPLGQHTVYPEHYSPALLHPIARADNRRALPELRFYGEDIWNAWELSWLDLQGKPEVAWGVFRVPCDSPQLIESKSLKLYLNSLNQTRYASPAALGQVIAGDLSRVAGAPVQVAVAPLAAADCEPSVSAWAGSCLDPLPVATDCYEPAPQLLSAGGDVVEESLYSHLLRSRCPVTGQPDWGSVQIRYRGPRIDREGLLRYIISFRQHQDFHEHCVERMFCDISARCAPESLQVYARYLRRGGLDINPFRSSDPAAPAPANIRLSRQ